MKAEAPAIIAEPVRGRPFARMNGLGNEILVVDLRGGSAASRLHSACVRALAKEPGLGFDQLMAVFDPRSAAKAPFVRIYNADGSESAACGNGARCVAWYLMRETGERSATIETPAGTLACESRGDWTVSVDMGEPRFSWRDIPIRNPVENALAADLPLVARHPALGRPALVNMGNPHAIFWVDEPEDADLATIGPDVENDPDFPERVNVTLAKVRARDSLAIRVWERGAGLTLACGTAACASAAAAMELGFCDRRVRVALPGGELCIERSDDGRIQMTGPCALEHEGRL
jgi:diaminopimelate epimerase